MRHFPKRKMVFVPQAICHTVVPDKFLVLLSQRRRWINSTIHNLFELVKVKELCGIFCFSMRFVVIIDLIGTVLLPGAILLLIYFFFQIITLGNVDLQSILLVIGTLGIPGIVIAIVTGNLLYIFWLFIYLLALPIWNLLLPLYAFAKFDDFSWGQTRKVRNKNQNHTLERGSFVIGSVPLKRYKLL